EQVVLGRRDADERHDVTGARGRREHPHCLESRAGVLLVQEDELRPGGRREACDARRRELEHHRAERDAALTELPLDRILPHASLPLMRGWSSAARLTTSRGTRPCATARTCSQALRPVSAKCSSVRQTACGVRITLTRARSGSSVEIGSCSKTSSAAPAIRRSWSTRVSAVWSTMGPRAMLIRNAVGCISASLLA